LKLLLCRQPKLSPQHRACHNAERSLLVKAAASLLAAVVQSHPGVRILPSPPIFFALHPLEVVRDYEFRGGLR
jgi:hypothetical protein